MEGWSEDRARYCCVDGHLIAISRLSCVEFLLNWDEAVHSSKTAIFGPESGLVRRRNGRWSERLFISVSRTLMDKRMSDVISCPEGARVTVPPMLAEENREGDFAQNASRSATRANRKLRSFVAPPSLRIARAGAFRYSKSLRVAVLNEGLETIARQCFEYANIEKITVPASVRKIGKSAFFSCKRLRTIEFPPDSRLE